MEWFGIIAAVLTFLAVFFAVFALNLVLTDVFKKDQSELEQLHEAEFREFERRKIRETLNVKRDVSLSEMIAVATADDEHSKPIARRLKDMCAQSGLEITLGRLMTYSLVAASVGGLLAGGLTLNLAAGAAAFLLCGALPVLYVHQRFKQRLELLRSQLPDAFELMSRILRSGQTISQGMYAVSEEFKAPVATEFGYCYEQQNLGLDAELALKELASRSGLMELKIFSLAVLVHRQTGGNLTELLDKLANIVRSRLRLRGDIQSLTAEGRMQAAILLGMPIAIWVGLYFINRPYAVKLFEHPGLIVVTLVSMAVGAVWINKIVNFDF